MVYTVGSKPTVLGYVSSTLTLRTLLVINRRDYRKVMHQRVAKLVNAVSLNLIFYGFESHLADSKSSLIEFWW